MIWRGGSYAFSWRSRCPLGASSARPPPPISSTLSAAPPSWSPIRAQAPWRQTAYWCSICAALNKELEPGSSPVGIGRAGLTENVKLLTSVQRAEGHPTSFVGRRAAVRAPFPWAGCRDRERRAREERAGRSVRLARSLLVGVLLGPAELALLTRPTRDVLCGADSGDIEPSAGDR